MRAGMPPEERVWRLSPARVLEIRDVAAGVEETNAGVCCRYLLDVVAGSADVDSDGYVHHLEAVEHFVERYGDFGRVPLVASWRSRIERCRRALARLRKMNDHRSPGVLLVAYGPLPPAANDLVEILGRDLAPLARHTPTVEASRLELAQLEAVERTRVASCENTGPLDLRLYRSRLAWARRVVTPDDALRAINAPFSEPPIEALPDEPMNSIETRRGVRHDRQMAYKNKRDAIMFTVKLEARRLLLDAERAYHAAWLLER